MTKESLNIMTKRGDHGFSDIFFGVKREKYSQLFTTLADLNNLNVDLKIICAEFDNLIFSKIIRFLRIDLHSIVASCSVPIGFSNKFAQEYSSLAISEDNIIKLELIIKHALTCLSYFDVNPTKTCVFFNTSTRVSVYFDKAYATAQVVEISFNKLKRFQESLKLDIFNAREIAIYLNRLNDLLFLLARLLEASLTYPSILDKFNELKLD